MRVLYDKDNLYCGIYAYDSKDSYWSPLPRIYNLQRVSLAGTLEDLEDIRPGSNIRIWRSGMWTGPGA